MNGAGWVCDECGKTEVVPGDPTRPLRLPDDWYSVAKAAEYATQHETWEFCSVECIHAQTAPAEEPPRCSGAPCTCTNGWVAVPPEEW